jgi:D-beta-D-heptose 7-phosphate kinase/D-beta-D-heptose 1-phosphate adenosyltransferase
MDITLVQPVPAPPSSELKEAIRRMRRTSVLVVGDVMLDRYVYGTVGRISPEAPIPVLSVEREIAVPGGAGNVVRSLAALGVATAFVSVVGDDQTGSDLTGLIGGQANVEPWLLVQGGRLTTLKTRFLGVSQHLLRADWEIAAPVHPKLAERLLRIAQDAMTMTSATALSDYGKGVLAEDVAAKLIAAGRASGRPVVVDPRGTDYARYAGADVIVPTEIELARETGLGAKGDAQLREAATVLRERHGFGAVVTLRGQAGLSCTDAEGTSFYPIRQEAVFDVTGSSDCAVGTLAAALGAGLSLSMAMQITALATSIACGHTGPANAIDLDLLSTLERD